MSYQYPADVWQSSITPGTGPVTLTGTAANLRTFQAGLGSTAIVFYIIKGETYIEAGKGTFDAGTQTLTRDLIAFSSNAGSLVDLPAGTHSVFVTYPGEPWFFDSFFSSHTLSVLDHGNVQQFTGSFASTLSLPPVAGVPAGFKAVVFNDGTAALTLDPNAVETIEGTATLVLLPGQSGILSFDNSAWRFKRFARSGKVTMASAATVDLANASGNYIRITGNAGPITSFGTIPAGEEFQLEFDADPIVVHNANILLPGGFNRHMAAGDCLRLVSEGAGAVRSTALQTASGAPIIPPNFYTVRPTSSFTIPAWSTAETIFEFELVGGGGGGGYGRANTNGTGGGGASGDHIKVAFKGFTPGQVVTVNIGAAGSRGTSAGSPATNGGDTTLVYAGETITISAGGLAGQNDALGTLPVGGGALGSTTTAAVGSTGLTLIYSTIVAGHGAGQPGGYPNFANAGQFYTSGKGGSNPLGAGGQESLNGSDGKDGTGFGAGGSGGSRYIADQNGGHGTLGACFVRYAG